ncbi:RloB family protein [Providencia huaxiensis]|uniref:RloB family protein n=1 Tax=Providencia TaxID=586 RepID=UPI0018C829B2|nr:RloB family protein [Providencia rettgeri]MBG5923147.1 RloB domain-containing protein [Providencia rettgeri]MBS0918269.1 RloB domain-containing protein [Providencia rettgeri]HEC8346254.1 RloB domain-containing protein [Providencia rettgeri]HEM6857211.1 RloB domain-containing protein [Providencia rettgeri]
MGSDDLFKKKKRKAKATKDLARKKSNKTALTKILIVCEGKKTEPKYFLELVEHLKITTAYVIDVTGECGSSPMSVVNHAKEIQREQVDKGSAYDEIYIVIDKDAHVDYMRALDVIRRSKPSNIFNAINSIPCFEYWLLLHYTNSRKAYENLPGNSSGNQIIKDLKVYIKDYDKGADGIFYETFGSLKSGDLQEVIKKSEACCLNADETGCDNPSTKVHILIKRLLELQAHIQLNKKNK